MDRNLVNSANPGNMINHWSMSQPKDSMSQMCLAGTVEASWFLKQEVADSNPFTAIITNIFVTDFSENI